METEKYKQVVFIEDDAKAIAAKFSQNNELENISVLSYQFDRDDFYHKPGIEILGAYPYIGTCYIRHPFRPNCYININEAEKLITDDKWIKFCGIAQRLGAKSFSGVQKEQKFKK